jgi:transcription elongation regulator 1
MSTFNNDFRMREKRDKYIKFMEECNLTTKTTFSEFSAKYGKDERFKGVEKSRERENLFNEHIVDLRRREKEERQAKREQGQRTEKKIFVIDAKAE